ncbi:sensor histidine kinase [Streptomyces sp. NPDC051217]|uniref:sensor histidine kinase n=1 Tax=Streptomyces sp. NPDC051217 TaxID=3365644 RepID=UPI0037BDD7D8
MSRAEPRSFYTRNLTPRQLLFVDALLAIGYVAMLILLRHAGQPPGALRHDLPGWVADALIVASGLPLTVRRLWPLPVLAVVLTASSVSLLIGIVEDPFIVVAFALYPVALARPVRNWVPLAAAGLLGLAGLIAAKPDTTSAYWWLNGPGPLLIGWTLIAGVWALGSAVRERRAYAIRAADQLTARAAAGERLRIARELHDIVAHSLGVIAVKAAVANHVVKTRPEEVPDALGVIETTSRDALTEMRHLLGVLRSDEYGAGTPADLGPSPGPEGLSGLAERAELAGLRVDMDVRGTDRLPEAMGLTVYRIVQEALTNAARHAAPAHCQVLVETTAHEVRIDVTDDGRATRGGPMPPCPPAGGGHGLIGMRERVAMYGGAFSAGARTDGGFAVSARIPREPSPRPGGVTV